MDDKYQIDMNHIKLLLYLGIAFGLFCCQKSELSEPLLDGKYKHCHLSKYYINNVLQLEVTYQEDNPDKIHQIVYYINGQKDESSTETVTYDGKNISKIAAQFYTAEYFYNDKSDLTEIKVCGQNGCESTQFNYNYDITNLPLVVKYFVNNQLIQTRNYEYTNVSNRSYLVSTYNSNNQIESIYQYQKFVSNIVDPIQQLFPNGIDYFMTRHSQKIGSNTIVETVISDDDLLHVYFPKKAISTSYNFANGSSQSATYTYEYINCN